MGFVSNNCLRLGLQALLVFLSRREALTLIAAVEVQVLLTSLLDLMFRHYYGCKPTTTRILFHLADFVRTA